MTRYNFSDNIERTTSRFTLVTCISSLLLLTNCATVFKGYFSEVPLNLKLETTPNDSTDGTIAMIRIGNDLKSISFYSADSVFIPIVKKQELYTTRTKEGFYVEQQKFSLYLRSNCDHTLVAVINNNRYPVKVYKKIGIGWSIADIILGVFPWVIDLYTGNLNYFDPIESLDKE